MDAIQLDAQKQNLEVSIKQQAADSILSSTAVLEAWEDLAGNIPLKYEKYSLALLGSVVELWLNIRGHSFARGWTMNLESKYEKRTRNNYRTNKFLTQKYM